MAEEYISAREFARRTGFNNVWISRLVKQGKIRTNDKGKIPYSVGLKDLESSRTVGYENNQKEHKEFDEQLAKQASNQTSDEMSGVKSEASVNLQFNKARAAEKTFAAKLRELEYKKEKGELIEVSEVERQMSELASEFREKLLAMGARIVPMLENKTLPEMKRVIDDSVNIMIKEFHDNM